MPPPDARLRLAEAAALASSPVGRARAVAGLYDLFDRGAVAEPPPHGLLAGRVIAFTMAAPLDALARGVAGVYMPWLGKRFGAGGGVNVLRTSALLPMRVLWPTYRPEVTGHRIEAFRFETRLGASRLDRRRTVLEIDYDLEANPRFLIRRLLDELVRIDDGLYLGRSLLRAGGRLRVLGFFSLEQ